MSKFDKFDDDDLDEKEKDTADAGDAEPAEEAEAMPSEAPAPAAAAAPKKAPAPPKAPPAPPAAEAESPYLQDDEAPTRTTGRAKAVALVFTVIVLAIVAVGAYMGWRFSQRFVALNVCRTQFIQGDAQNDFVKPEFSPCVRGVLQASRYEDVVLEAIRYSIMADDEEAIPLLITLLQRKGDVLRNAAMAIAKIGGEKAPAAREPLFQRLQTAGPRDKVILAWALVSLGDERAFRALLDGYIEGYTRELEGWNDDFLINYAASDPKAMDEMARLADAPDAAHRWFAATTMGKMRSGAVVPTLVKLSSDQNSNVVKAAAISLGMTGAPEAGPVILSVMGTYPEMTEELLRSIQQSAGAPGLAQVYSKATSPSLKSKIVSYIREVRDPRAGDIIMEILKDVEKETAGKGITAGLKTKKELTLALSDIGDARAIPLIAMLMGIEDVEAVCKLYDCGGVADFAALGKDQREGFVRGYRMSPAMSDYIKGLVNIGNEEAKKTLWGLLNRIADYDARYRGDAYLYWPCRPAEVMYALGRLKAEGLGPVLTREICSNAKANQRAIALNVGTAKDLTIPCPDIEAAAKALGRAKYAPILKTLVEIAKRPKDIDFTVPNVDNENIYSDRRVVLQGMSFLGDPGAIPAIETILDDVTDYLPTKDAAANALPYVITPEKQAEILGKVKDSGKDTWVRSWYARSLIPRASEAIAAPLLELLMADPPNPLLTPLGVALGETCNQEVLARAMDFVEKAEDPGALSEAQASALLAVVLCGDEKVVAKAMRYVKRGDNEDRIRNIYTNVPFFLTEEAFGNGRVYKKLRAAAFLKGKDVLWPWQYLTDRMALGYEDNPDGLSSLDSRKKLYARAVEGGPDQEVAIKALLGMKERGYVLALTKESGDVSKAAWESLREAQ